MANELAQTIEHVIGPLVGAVLAGVSVDLEAKRIGKTTDTIDATDLGTLADNLEAQLRLLVGREMAESAAHKVRMLR